MINLINTTKEYGKTQAISNMTIDIPQPGIYCLLGRNGAGKSTMLKLISGHINASSGSVKVNGKYINSLNMPEDVHFISSDASHFNMKINELFKAAFELGEGFDYDLAISLANKFNLDISKKYNKLSFGMKVMVNTILGMASGEDILILDEPVLGFDAFMRKSFYEMLYECYTIKPKTIIISTHLIDEIADIAEKLIIIDEGKLILLTDINDVYENAYVITGHAQAVEKASENLRVLQSNAAGGFITKIIYDKRIEESNEYSISNVSLQDFFMGLVGQKAAQEEMAQ